MRCERIVDKERCKATATVFVMGQNVCAAHEPRPATTCSHSVGVDRCGYCGARL